MKRILVLGLCLLAAGCTTNTPSIEGAGFVLTHPQPGTRDFIIKNDRKFAEETAGNNRACNRSPACIK